MLASVRGDCKLQCVLGSETIPLTSLHRYRSLHDPSVTGITSTRRYRSRQSEECDNLKRYKTSKLPNVRRVTTTLVIAPFEAPQSTTSSWFARPDRSTQIG